MPRTPTPGLRAASQKGTEVDQMLTALARVPKDISRRVPRCPSWGQEKVTRRGGSRGVNCEGPPDGN